MAHLYRYDYANEYFFKFNIKLNIKITQYEFCIVLYVHKCLISQDNAILAHRPNYRYHLRNTSRLQLPQCCSTQSQAFINFAGVQT